MAETELRDLDFYIDGLLSEECQCGRPKKRHNSFCYGCYKGLPHDMQRALYNRIGFGYRRAYEAAVAFLTD